MEDMNITVDENLLFDSSPEDSDINEENILSDIQVMSTPKSLSEKARIQRFEDSNPVQAFVTETLNAIGGGIGTSAANMADIVTSPLQGLARFHYENLPADQFRRLIKPGDYEKAMPILKQIFGNTVGYGQGRYLGQYGGTETFGGKLAGALSTGSEAIGLSTPFIATGLKLADDTAKAIVEGKTAYNRATGNFLQPAFTKSKTVRKDLSTPAQKARLEQGEIKEVIEQAQDPLIKQVSKRVLEGYINNPKREISTDLLFSGIAGTSAYTGAELAKSFPGGLTPEEGAMIGGSVPAFPLAIPLAYNMLLHGVKKVPGLFTGAIDAVTTKLGGQPTEELGPSGSRLVAAYDAAIAQVKSKFTKDKRTPEQIVGTLDANKLTDKQLKKAIESQEFREILSALDEAESKAARAIVDQNFNDLEQLTKTLTESRVFSDPVTKKQITIKPVLTKDEFNLLALREKIKLTPGEESAQLGKAFGLSEVLNPQARKLLATQADVVLRMTPEDASTEVLRKLNAATAIDNFQKKVFGAPESVSPLFVYDVAKNKLYESWSALGDDVTKLGNNVKQLIDPNNPEAPLTQTFQDGAKVKDRSAFIRSQLEILNKQKREELNDIASGKKIMPGESKPFKINENLVFAKTGTLEQARIDLKANLDKTLYPTRKGQPEQQIRTSDYTSDIQRFLNSPATNITFGNWKTLRINASDALGKSLERGNSSEIKQNQIFIEVLDNFAANYREGKDFENFSKFQDYISTNVKAPFEAGPAYLILQKGPGSSSQQPYYRTASEQIANAFLGGRPEEAEVFFNFFGDNPELMKAVKDVLIDKAYRVATDTGTFTTKAKPIATGVVPKALEEEIELPAFNFNLGKYQKWFNENEETLKALGVQEDFNSIKKFLESASSRSLELSNTAKIIANSELNKNIAKAINKENISAEVGENANAIIDLMVGARDFNSLRELRKLAFSADNVQPIDSNLYEQAWRAKVFESILRNFGTFKDKDSSLMVTALSDPQTFKDFLDNNGDMLTKGAGMSISHVKAVYDLVDLVQRLQLTGLPQKGMDGQTYLDSLTKSLGTSPASLFSQLRSVKEGRMAGQQMAFGVFTKALENQKKGAVDNLIRDSILDPKLARVLTSDRPNQMLGSMSGPQQRFIHSYLFQIGYPYGANFKINPELETTLTPEDQFNIQEREQPENKGIDVEITPETNIQGALPPAMTMPQQVDVANLPIPQAVTSNLGPNTPTVSPTALFPFDPTVAALEARKADQGGIASLS
jgi:hypothetical protein